MLADRLVYCELRLEHIEPESAVTKAQAEWDGVVAKTYQGRREREQAGQALSAKRRTAEADELPKTAVTLARELKRKNPALSHYALARMLTGHEELERAPALGKDDWTPVSFSRIYTHLRKHLN